MDKTKKKLTFNMVQSAYEKAIKKSGESMCILITFKNLSKGDLKLIKAKKMSYEDMLKKIDKRFTKKFRLFDRA